MVDIYCRDHHPPDGWHRCPNCEELLSYAKKRLEKCPFQEEKGICSACPVHCYKSDFRLRARDVMRHSGPRMIFYHPISAIRHLIAEWNEPAEHPWVARKKMAATPEPSPPRSRRMSEDCLNVPFPPIY